MKKILLITCLLLLGTFSSAQNNNVVTLEGTITNKTFDFIKIDISGSKTIKISKEGVFKDTIDIKKQGIFNLWLGNHLFYVFFKKDFDLKLSMNFDKKDTLFFSGNGGAENNFLNSNDYMPNPIYFNRILGLKKTDFLKEMKKFRFNLLKKLKTENLDSDFKRIYKDYVIYYNDISLEAYNKKSAKVNL
jgi:hypothetical protein